MKQQLGVNGGVPTTEVEGMLRCVCLRGRGRGGGVEVAVERD
eukprot:CAMPEP_0196599924 /NCGR_PEP_ID=MMETSP1081-20130531/95118_1 /TAXON_ID=36882 /ORGANISM="Pyramimonas amylifera, Strain CCMP720" /LENGTH=41 /DNA_ID= /DNA_START= /DNA_END= /DNA_ORIENTATION=